MGSWALANQADSYWGGWDANNAVHGGPTVRVTTPSQITALRFWRDDAGSATPDTIGVFRVSDQVMVGSQSPVLDDFNAGWQVTPLDVPIDIQDGVDYFAAAHWPNGGGHGVSPNGGTLSALPSGYILTTDNRREITSSSFVYPTNSIPDYIFAVDMFVEFGPPPHPAYAGLNAGDIYNELYKWLSASGSEYPGSPLDLIQQASSGNSGKLDTLLGRLTASLAAKLDAGMDTIGSWLSTEADWYTTLVGQTAPKVADLVDWFGTYTGTPVFTYLADLIRWANGVYDRPQLADTTDWELLDETDFTDNLLWPVEADVYRVTLTSFDPAGTSEPVGTETRHGYLGKWCPFNVQFSSEWHYFNTESADLSLNGRMPGLGLILYRPGTGHVQAWRRAETP